METYLERMELLIGKAGLRKLKETAVMVVGIGGVGSYAAEELARCGIGKLILVDADHVAPSNLNRQLHASFSTLNRLKVDVMKERILTFRDDCDIQCHACFYDSSVNDQLFNQPIDFVIDAIDTLTSKADLIQYCLRQQLPFISSMGMANRWDPTKIIQCDLMKTSYDPLAKVMRQIIRKRSIKGRIPVVFSTEIPFVQKQIVNAEGVTRKQKMPPASTPFVPSAAGIACASYAVRSILQDVISDERIGTSMQDSHI